MCNWCVTPQLKVPTTDKPCQTVNFRKMLLDRCQIEFEKDHDNDELFEKKQKELDTASEVGRTTTHHAGHRPGGPPHITVQRAVGPLHTPLFTGLADHHAPLLT